MTSADIRERCLSVNPRAWDALRNLWYQLRDNASPVQMRSAGAVVLFAYHAGLLTSEQADLWWRRIQTCPGHDDEGGRVWCAYCGDLKP
jgi:hypothetical protein